MSSKTKVTAIVEPCESREEFENAIDQIARLDIQAQKLAVAIKQKHQEIDDKFGKEVEDIRTEIERLQNNALPYFLKHQEEVCKKGQKEGETKLAKFGIRTGMPKFVKRVKTALAALADEWFGDASVKDFVKTARSIDQKAVIELWSTDREKYDAIFGGRRDVKVTQEDNFWVEPKADDQVK